MLILSLRQKIITIFNVGKQNATSINNEFEKIMTIQKGKLNLSKRQITIIASVLAILVVLSVAFGVGLHFFLDSNKENRQLFLDQKIKFVSNGVEVAVLGVDQMKDLGLEVCQFEANLDTSDMISPDVNIYKGFRLVDIIEKLELDIVGKSGVKFSCRDGDRMRNLGTMLSRDIYIAFESNGEPIEADNPGGEDGGRFVLIPATESFSQNRVKWIVGIEIV